MNQEFFQLDVTPDGRLIAAEAASRRAVEWTIRAPQVQREAARAPLNLALVLDRSGSMRGDKLRFVRQAAKHVLELLEDNDRLAVVAYDNHIAGLAESETTTERSRREIAERIDELQPGGWTDLSGGWLEGCRQVASHQDPAMVNRTLLLTDGLANQGITDIEELAHHARELRRRGITTSTFGVGLDFNEHLLEALANEGSGHFFYIERPSQIPDVFRAALGELQTVVAREAVLAISIPNGVTVEVLGDLPHELDRDKIRIFLGDMYAGEQRSLYTYVITPPDHSRSAIILHAELGYADVHGGPRLIEAEVVFSYRREAEVLRMPLDTEMLGRLGNIEVATAAARALRLERRGLRQQAQVVLQQSLGANASYLATDTAESYTALAAQLDHELSEEQRKATHFAAYKTRHSRS